MTQHVLLLFISHQLLLLLRFQTDAAAPSVFRHPQRASTEIGTFDKTFEARFRSNTNTNNLSFFYID